MDLKELRLLLCKVVKRTAYELNTVTFIEKKNDSFLHTNVSHELERLVMMEEIYGEINKNHPLDITEERKACYEKAWGGEEVSYQVKCSLNKSCLLYVVLTPILYGGKVVNVIGYIIPFKSIPQQLRGLIA